MIKSKLLTMCCLSVLVACSTVKSVPSSPVQPQQVNQLPSAKVYPNASNKKIKLFDRESFVMISELTSLDGILTAKANNIYQNKQTHLYIRLFCYVKYVHHL